MLYIPYLFKKDFLRLRILLFVWFLLILIQSTLGISGMNLAVNNIEFQMFFPLLTKLINFLQGMMIIVIVPLFIQDDSLVGTNAFWVTRPISRKGLLFTKACFALTLLILPPFIAEFFVLYANGVTAHHILLAVPEILIEKLAFIIPFFILSVLTPKFSRYALIGIIIFAVFVVIGILHYILSMFFPIYSKFVYKFLYNFDLYKNPTLELSTKVAEDIYIIVFGSILIAHQFLTRYTARTVRWLVIAYLVMFSVTRLWHWDFLKEVPVAESSAAMSYSINIDFDTGHVIVSDEFRVRKNDVREKSISVKQSVSGLPLAQFAILRKLQNVQMKYPDGTVLKSKYVSTSKKDTFFNEKFMPPLQVVLKDIKLLNPFIGKFSYIEVFSLEEPDFNRYKNKVGTYSAYADFDIYKYKISSVVPLKQGAKDLFGSEQIIIYDVLERPNGISVVLGEKKTNLLFDRSIKKQSRYDLAIDIYSDFNRVYLIINKKRGEAFLAEVGGHLFADMTAVYGRSRLETKAKLFDFLHVNDRSGSLPKINQGWLTSAELVRIDAVKIAVLHKDFQVKPFLLPAQSTVLNPEIDDVDRQLKQSERQYEEQMKKWEQE